MHKDQDEAPPIASELEANAEISSAVEAGRKSLEAYRRVMGDDAEDTLHDQAQYAWLLMRSGNLSHAEEVALDAFEPSTERLGRTHWATQAARSALAATYISQGKIDAAEDVYGHRRLPEDLTIEHEFQGSFDPDSSPFQLLVFFES